MRASEERELYAAWREVAEREGIAWMIRALDAEERRVASGEAAAASGQTLGAHNPPPGPDQ